MAEQSPEPQSPLREDGRPNPEERLRRYRLRDSDALPYTQGECSF